MQYTWRDYGTSTAFTSTDELVVVLDALLYHVTFNQERNEALYCLTSAHLNQPAHVLASPSPVSHVSRIAGRMAVSSAADRQGGLLPSSHLWLLPLCPLTCTRPYAWAFD